MPTRCKRQTLLTKAGISNVPVAGAGSPSPARCQSPAEGSRISRPDCRCRSSCARNARSPSRLSIRELALPVEYALIPKSVIAIVAKRFEQALFRDVYRGALLQDGYERLTGGRSH